MSEPSGTTSKRQPFPFVIGSGRAGTTLLRAMLDSHPELAIPPENYLITELAPASEGGGDGEAHGGAGADGPEDGFSTEAFLQDLTGHPWFGRFELTGEDVRRELDQGEAAGFADGIRALYAAYARSHGKPRYGDKTPAYVHDIDAIASLFEEARFVHLIRDGRDVACSFLGQDDMRPNGLIEAALLWRERVETGRSAGERLGSQRYLELRYEHLIADPEVELRRICEFAALDYEPEMLSYQGRAEDLTKHDGGPERHRGVFMPPTRGLRRWQDELSPAQVEAFELAAGELLGQLGYERATEAVPPDPESPLGVLLGEVERLRVESVAVETSLRRRVRRLRAQRNRLRAADAQRRSA